MKPRSEGFGNEPMKMFQLDPPIPVFLIEGPPRNWPAGKATCVAWIDYSQEHNTLWKCALDDGGEVWDVPQSHVRLQINGSMLRGPKAAKAGQASG